MNHSFKTKCKVCETPYLIKYQVGYVPENHFSFECPTCGVMIEGTINVDNKNVRIGWNFDNLIDFTGNILESKEGYCIQLTGEFYDEKLSSLKDYFPFTPSPFMRNLGPHIEKMNGLAVYLAEDIQQDVNNHKNLVNLVLSNKNNVKYVYSELKRLIGNLNIPEEKFATDYNINRYSILFSAIVNSISPLLKLNEKKFQVDDIKNNLYKMYEDNIEFQKVKDLFQDKLPSLINSLINAFYSSISIIPNIVPIITSETFNHKKIETIKEDYGLSTANYKTLLQNYAENYEILGKIIPLIVVIDNIINRKDINKFSDNTNSLENFLNKPIGLQIQYLKKISSGVSRYNDLSILNNKIRNAINHASVEYESISQKLIFKDKKITTEKYLIEFAEENYVMLYLQLYCLFIVCSLATKFSKIDAT